MMALGLILPRDELPPLRPEGGLARPGGVTARSMPCAIVLPFRGPQVSPCQALGISRLAPLLRPAALTLKKERLLLRSRFSDKFLRAQVWARAEEKPRSLGNRKMEQQEVPDRGVLFHQRGSVWPIAHHRSRGSSLQTTCRI